MRMHSILYVRFSFLHEFCSKKHHRSCAITNLGVLRFGDVDEDLGGGVHDVEEAHDGGAVVGDGGALVVVDELVHPAGAQRGPHRVRHRRARADVADHLRAALRRVRPLLEQDDLRLHHRRHGWWLRGGGARVWSEARDLGGARRRGGRREKGFAV